MPQQLRPKGNFGEEQACIFLKNKGYQIVTRNFHCRMGEIDIIALKNKRLIFVEVKTRFGTSYGLPQEAVTKRKLQSIIKTGEYFKLLHPNLPDSMQIDVVAIQMNQQNQILNIEHLENVTS